MKGTSKFVFECPPTIMEKPSMGLIATLIEKGYHVMYVFANNVDGGIKCENVGEVPISNIVDYYVEPIKDDTEAAFILYFKVKRKEKPKDDEA